METIKVGGNNLNGDGDGVLSANTFSFFVDFPYEEAKRAAPFLGCLSEYFDVVYKKIINGCQSMVSTS